MGLNILTICNYFAVIATQSKVTETWVTCKEEYQNDKPRDWYEAKQEIRPSKNYCSLGNIEAKIQRGVLTDRRCIRECGKCDSFCTSPKNPDHCLRVGSLYFLVKTVVFNRQRWILPNYLLQFGAVAATWSCRAGAFSPVADVRFARFIDSRREGRWSNAGRCTPRRMMLNSIAIRCTVATGTEARISMPALASRTSRMPESSQNCYTTDDAGPSRPVTPWTHSPVPVSHRTPNSVVYAMFFRKMWNLFIFARKTTSQKNWPVSVEVRISYKQS